MKRLFYWQLICRKCETFMALAFEGNTVSDLVREMEAMHKSVSESCKWDSSKVEILRP